MLSEREELEVLLREYDVSLENYAALMHYTYINNFSLNDCIWFDPLCTRR
jgi:hypothetical protein